MAVPNSTWLGNYQVERQLGAGGMGEVYLVHDRTSGRKWALKTMDGAIPGTAPWQRFVNEGRVLSELSHPAIASFHEMFVVETRPCLVMEYVDGETLFERVRRQGPLPIDETLAVLSTVAEALSYLAGKGVMHRDWKSANIKISVAGEVKLLDFGIARQQRVPGITVAGMMIGTPDHLSPEQILGAPADLRSEIWMVGLLTYEMLTGRLPFTGDNDMAIYQSIRDETPPRPSLINPATPAGLDRLVMRCLEKSPSRRYQSAGELLTAAAKAAGPVRAIPRKWMLRAAAAALFLISMLLLFDWSPASGEVRTITVEVVEGRAEVYANGARVGSTPYRVQARAGESIQLELRRAGFLDQAVQFDVSERTVYSYALQPAAR